MNEQKKQAYQEKVEQLTPVHSLFLQCLKAFIVGGLICVLGQFIMNRALAMGLSTDDAASWCSLILIFLSVLLTATNIYPRIAKFSGAGSLVPITGFANSVACAAIEFHPEGQVFGIGCKIFTIAGPVILYGIVSSWILGIIYWIMKIMG